MKWSLPFFTNNSSCTASAFHLSQQDFRAQSCTTIVHLGGKAQRLIFYVATLNYKFLFVKNLELIFLSTTPYEYGRRQNVYGAVLFNRIYCIHQCTVGWSEKNFFGNSKKCSLEILANGLKIEKKST